MTLSVICDPHYHGDRLFDATDPSRNRDDCLRPWIRLAEVLRGRGHEVHTEDLLRPDDADLRLYCEVPSTEPTAKQGNVLVNFESPIVRRPGNDSSIREWFDRIYSWADKPAGQPNYFRIPVPYSGRRWTGARPGPSDRLLCLISGNKTSDLPGELYTLRRRIIRWFEHRRPGTFSYYGPGWDRGEPVFVGLLGKVARRLGFEPRRAFQSPGTPVESKGEVLSRHRYCLALENVAGFSGYITEKIFDPMLAGCVPVYWGAPDIGNWVPPECFVDVSHRSASEIGKLLLERSEEDRQKNLEAIDRFLAGPLFERFSVERFAQTVADGIESCPARTKD